MLQKDLYKREWLIGWIIIVWIFAIPFWIFSIAITIAVPPAAIVFAPLSILLGIGIKKLTAKSKKLKNSIKSVAPNHKLSANMLGDVVYHLASPLTMEETIRSMARAFVEAGGVVKKCDETNGVIRGKILLYAGRKVNVQINAGRGDSMRKVQAFFYRGANDDVWDMILQKLFIDHPDIDFGVSLANGSPYVAGCLHLGENIEQVNTSYSTSRRSLTGFLLGGALFGEAGAIVGGLGGSSTTIGTTTNRFGKRHLARIIYNNGRIWEGELIKGSSLYNEVIVNMK